MTPNHQPIKLVLTLQFDFESDLTQTKTPD